MPNIGNHVDAVFLPESVNTSTTLRINGGDLHLDDGKKALFGQGDDLQIFHDGSNNYILGSSGNIILKNSSSNYLLANTTTGAVELNYNNSKKLETTSTGIDVTGNDIKVLGPTSGSTFTTSTLSLRGFRQSAAGQFGVIDFKNIDANTSNTEYIGARIGGQLGAGANGGELKFFVTPNNSTTLTSTPVLTLHDDSSAEFSSDLTIGGNLTVNGTTTTINSTTMTVDDLNLTLASGAANSAAADGAGITIDGANQSLKWVDSNECFRFTTRLAIGSGTTQGSTLRLSKDLGGESFNTYYAILNNGLIQPDVTGTAYYNLVQIRTDGNSGTAYTINNIEAYAATVSNTNADSTITNLTGFNVKNSWTAGTNNYGFRGQIADAANRWNVYMDGTAPNYFAGNVGIGTTTPTEKLHVKGIIRLESTSTSDINNNFSRVYQNSSSTVDYGLQLRHYQGDTGYGDALIAIGGNGASREDNIVFYRSNGSGGLTETMRIDSSGRVGIGTSTPGTALQVSDTVTNPIQVKVTSTQTSAGARLGVGSTGNSIPVFADNTVLEGRDGGVAIGTGGNDPILFYTTSGRTERLRITSTGNVGIGTSSPDQKITVAGNIKASSTSPTLFFEETDASANNQTWVYQANGGDLIWSARNDSGAGGGNTFRMTRVAEQVNSFQGRNSGNSWFIIDNLNKRVGIGTDDPQSTLAVKNLTAFTLASSTVDYTVFLEGGSTQGENNYGASIGFSRLLGGQRTGAVIATKQTSSDADQQGIAFLTHPSSNTASDLVEQMLIKHDGNVGIGTTSPSTKLEVQSGVMPLTIKRTDNAGDLVNLRNNNFHYVIGGDNGSLYFKTNGTAASDERLRITSTGNVGIGTSSPTSELEVAGSVSVSTAGGKFIGPTAAQGSSATNPSFSFSGQQTGMYLAASNNLAFSTNGTEKVRIDSSGNVGIGTNAPTERLEVDGVILSSGPVVDTVWYKETWPAYSETTATLAGNDLGTWTLTGGTLATGTAAAAEVDLANLPSGLKAVRWNGNTAVSYFTSPTIDLSDFRTNEKITSVNQTGSLADRSVSDSRIYLTMLLAAQSMDSNLEHMEVQLSNDDGVTFHEHQAFVWQDNDADNDDITDTTWRKVVIDISEYTHASSTASSYGFKIRFMGTGVGGGDSYGVSNIYIHDAPIPNKLKAKTLKLGDDTLTESDDLDYDEYLEIVGSAATFKGLVLNNDSSVRDNYVGVDQADSLVLAADELNAGDNSRIDFRIDAKVRAKLYTSTNAGASEAHFQLIGHTTPTDRSNWRISAEDDTSIGRFSISDYGGGSWTENLAILSTGNVGIGQTSPAEKLDVSGNVKLTGQLYQSMPSDYWNQTATFIELNGMGNLTHQGSFQTCLTSNGYRDSNTQWKSYAINSYTGAAQIRLDPLGNIIFGTESNKADGSSHFVEERLRITSTGNVGIGNTDPDAILTLGDFAGPLNLIRFRCGTAQLSGIDFGDDDDADIGRIRYQHSDNSMLFHVNASEAMRINSSRNVGIGTTSPGGRLHVESAATTAGWQIRTDSVGLNNESGFYRDASDHYEMVLRNGLGGLSFIKNDGGASTANLRFNVQGNESLTILSNGNVGISTNAPTEKLHIYNGKIHVEDAVLNATNEFAIKSEATIDSVDRDTVFNLRLQTTMTNAGTTTGDREQGGIYNLITNNATGGDTSNEQRVYGVWNDINNYGDADHLYGTYNNIDTYHTSGTISSMYGAYNICQARAAGNVTNMYGVQGLAQPTSGSSGSITKLVGVRARTNLAGASSVTLQDQFGCWGNIDNDANVVATGVVACFYGSYDTTGDITKPYGIYMGTANLSHYLSGALGVGNANNPKSYGAFGALHIGDEATAATTNDIVFGKRVATSQTSLPRIGHCDILGTAANNDLGICATSNGGNIGFFTGNGVGGYGDSSNELRMIIKSGGNVGIGTNNPTDLLHVVGGDAHFEQRVGIGQADNSGYALAVKNTITPTTTGGIFVDCNDWSTNASEYGISVDIDSTDRTNLSTNRTHRGGAFDVRARVAQNATTTTGTRQSAYGIYASAMFDDTDDNDGKVYHAWGAYFRARVDGLNASNIRGSYSLCQAGDNATGSARTIDTAYGAYNYVVNDGNQTAITNSYGTYSHVNQDDSGGAMTDAYGVYSRVDRDSGSGGTGYAYRGVFEGTWSTKRGLWITGDTENSVDGSFSKGSGSFKIPHPLPEKNETHHLVHSFVESPQANNIYRGKVILVNGSATINLDTESTMTEGTFVLLNRDIHCFTSNESDWDAVRGSVSGNILTIECQDPSSTATVAWLVIGERHDKHMYDTGWTDDDGKVIVEPLQPEPEPENEKPEIDDEV